MLIVIVMVLIAMYWRLLVIGAGGVFIVWVFLNHQVIAKNIDQVENKVETAVESIQKPLENSKDEAIKKLHDEFMEDCMDVAANEQEECEDIWYDRQEHKKEHDREVRTARKDYQKGENI